MRVTEKFYKKLYKTEGINKEQARRNISTIEKKLTPKENKEIGSFFKEAEIKKMIKEMKNNKTLGEDGIPKEFYLHFYKHIKISLMEMLNSVAMAGELALSQKNAII